MQVLDTQQISFMFTLFALVAILWRRLGYRSIIISGGAVAIAGANLSNAWWLIGSSSAVAMIAVVAALLVYICVDMVLPMYAEHKAQAIGKTTYTSDLAPSDEIEMELVEA